MVGKKKDYKNILSEVPNTNRINEFVALWNGEISSKTFEIKIDNKEENLLDYKKFGMDFGAIREEEKLLDEKFRFLTSRPVDALDESFTIEMVRLLDAIYSTRLDNPTRFAIQLHELIKGGLLEEIKLPKEENNIKHAAECVDCIASIYVNSPTLIFHSAYSFATKFCNRINPSRFPIYDSYVDFLLYHYHLVECTRKELKDYKSFIKIYDDYIKRWDIDMNLNYKDVDIFMWTYGKAVKKSQGLDMSSSEKYARLKSNTVLNELKKNIKTNDGR